MQRGYNQSEAVARGVAAPGRSPVPAVVGFADASRRRLNTIMTRDGPEKNVRGVFAPPSVPLPDRTVLLSTTC